MKTWYKRLLQCGIVSSLWYTAVNFIVPPFWPAYNPASQTVSELSAVGAPTRQLWTWLCSPYTLLMIAFAWGVYKVAGNNRALRITGRLLLAYAMLGLIWPFAPMHQRAILSAGGGTLTDTLHLALGAVTELLFLLALSFAATVFNTTFRVYSLISLALLLIFGLLTFLAAPGVSANRPTPFIGVWERVNIGIFLLWVILLSATLLRQKSPENT